MFAFDFAALCSELQQSVAQIFKKLLYFAPTIATLVLGSGGACINCIGLLSSHKGLQKERERERRREAAREARAKETSTATDKPQKRASAD